MKTVIVLGSARSGTSMVAGLAQTLGVDMHGDVRLHESNPRGTFEDPLFVHLTTRTHVSMRKGEDLSRYKRQIKRAVELRAVSPLWGWKSALTHHMLHMFLPEVASPHLVAVFRNPVAHAQSMMTHRMTRYGENRSFRWCLQRAIDDVRLLAQALPRDAPKLVVQFEEIRSDPGQACKALAGFLDVAYPASVERACTELVIPDYQSPDVACGTRERPDREVPIRRGNRVH